MISLFDIANLELMVYQDDHPWVRCEEDKMQELRKFCDIYDMVTAHGVGTQPKFEINEDGTMRVTSIVYCIMMFESKFGRWEDLFDFPTSMSAEFLLKERKNDDDVCVMRIEFELPSIFGVNDR